MTDWDVTSSDTDESVIITTWHNLGNGDSNDLSGEVKRSPINLVWTTLAGGDEPCSCYMIEYTPGCVRDAFEKGNGSELAAIEAALLDE